MRAKFDRESLIEAWSVLKDVSPRKSPSSILENVKVYVEDGGATLCATDLEVHVEIKIGCEVEEDGAALLPALRSHAMFREIKDDFVLVASSKGKTVVSGGRSVYEMPTEDAALFADKPPLADADVELTLGVGVLNEAVPKLTFSCGDDGARRSLAGVAWELGGKSHLVSTDSRRLSVFEVDLLHDKQRTYIVPAKAMRLLGKVVADRVDGDVAIVMSESLASFSLDGISLTTRLVEGQFPPWRQVLPKSLGDKVRVVAGDILSAVTAAGIMSDKESRRVSFHFDGDRIRISAVSEGGAKSAVEVGADCGGIDADFSLNSRYLSEVLRCFDKDLELVWSFSGNASPVTLRHGCYLHCLMPLI